MNDVSKNCGYGVEMIEAEVDLVCGGIADPNDIYPDYMFRLVGPTVCRVYDEPGFQF